MSSTEKNPLIARLVAIKYELDQLTDAVKLLRSAVENHVSAELEALGATLHAALLQERIVQLQIELFNLGQEK